MFKNRELRVRIANTNKDVNAPTTVVDEPLNPDTVKLIEETGNRFVKRLALTVVAVVVAIKVADTLGEIAVKKTKSADSE